ncbi:tyrosine-protein kinase transmembrane receptor Ror-like [Apostichopus japonicus]|uniref:tyrosine-protein kinase transmembrane receptor Ror-like n=1 Tax=Stichopus japonicus TaxID=307972 RepID=UPI003AB24711
MYLVVFLTAGVVILGCLSIIWKKLCSPRTTITFPNGATSPDNRSTHVIMSSRELPPIGSNGASSSNIEQIRQEEVKQNHENESKCLGADDVKLSYQLSGEGTMTYWEGTISSGDMSSNGTKVIAKSVSESARMKEIMSFRALAKALITLPKHENIVDILGMSLEDVPYLIYQEYIEMGTLKDFLMRNYQQSSSGNSYKQAIPDYDKNLQLTTFAADICEGMVFLAKETYRHPGLSARKALLSTTGRCKLYDFWPADLATDVISHILAKNIPPIAWLAPETVFMGQYLEKSDVWSFGVVLWEIFSLGETPFGGLTCAEIESKLRRKDYLEQPMACAGGIYGAMLSMWKPAIDERPSFASLQMTLQGFLNSMRTSCNAAEEEPSYFSLDKDSSDDDYIEHIL